MLIDINPVLITIGPLAVGWFALLALVGLSLAIWLSLRDLDRQRVDRKLALDALAWGLPVGLLTARVVHVLGYWDYYLINSSELWRLTIDGLSLWGGLVGGGLIAAARLRRDPSRRRRILDTLVPYVALGIAVGRFGEFLEGYGQGLASSAAWATQYTNPLAGSPDLGVARHPAQIYDGLLALALFALLKALPRTLPAGTRLATFLLVYGLGRLMLGEVRLDPAFLFGLQIEQLLAAGGTVFAVVYGVRAWRRRATSSRVRLEQPEPARAAAHEDSLAA